MAITYIGVICNLIRRNTSVSTLENPIINVLHFRFIYAYIGLSFFFWTHQKKKDGKLKQVLVLWSRVADFFFLCLQHPTNYKIT